MLQVKATQLPAHSPPSNKDSWPKGSTLRKKFGQEILFWPRKVGGFHLSKEELEPYRLLGDEPMDTLLELLAREGRALGPTEDLFEVAERAQEVESAKRSAGQSALVAFMETYRKLPQWVDTEQLRRGQDVFLAYTPAASLVLYYRSLVAGFSIPKVAAVIQATSYLSPPARPDQSLQRLLDTGELNAACFGLGLDSILPGGLGWKTAIYVRVLHAKIRRSLLQRTDAKRWQTEKYGIPINQEDMSATLLAFSANVLDGIDILAGMQVPKQERLDYLALWRYIGWLLGVESEGDSRADNLPSINELPPLDPCGPGLGRKPDPCLNSTGLLDSFIDHLMDPDESSVAISHHLLKITDRKPPSLKLSEIPPEFYANDLFYFRCFQCRKLIGDPLADALQLPFHPNLWTRLRHRLKSTVFLSLFRCYTLATMWIPFVRRYVTQWHANGLIRFHEEWTKSHRTKMARALAKNDKATCLKSEEDEQASEEQGGDQVPIRQSICPFALVAQPQ